MPTARETAYELTRRVDSGGGYLSLLLRYNLEKSGLGARDRALVAELTYGVQRYRNRLDHIIASFSRRPLDELDPDLLDLLRLGVYQISEMRVPAHAAVNESVDLAKKRLHPGAASYANAVLRAASVGIDDVIWPGEDEIGAYLETVCSYPRWLVDYVISSMGEEAAKAFFAAGNAFPRLTLRVNSTRLDARALLAEIAARGGKGQPSSLLAEAAVNVTISREGLIDVLDRGYCVVQDQSSMLVAHAVDPARGGFFVDACAAPGGKATHLAELGGPESRVVAVDRNPSRLEALRGVVGRLGLVNVEVRGGDATRLSEYVPGPADAVLVDAPCSGLGTLQRRPELKWRRGSSDLADLARAQSELLDGCAPTVRRGGTLVYSVCTFTREETTDVIRDFLAANREYRLDPLAPHLPAGLAAEVGSGGCLQVMPHLHHMEGMFISRLVRA